MTAELEAFIHAPLTEMSYAAHVAELAGGRGGPRAAAPARRRLRRLGRPDARGPGQAPRRRRLQAPAEDRRLPPGPARLARSSTGPSSSRSAGDHGRHRDGFHLTDPGTDLAGALDQAGYCIKCHHQGKDSCSHGLREKTGRLQAERLRRPPGRLPARGEDLRDERGEGPGQPDRRPGRRHHRQPDVRRPPATGSATTA